PHMAIWGWEIAIYLFLGGLVAGLMIFGGALNLVAAQKFTRALLISNLTALPILGIGMLFLLIDLSNKINLWRFYVTFQWTSPMSWGAWILLFAMIVLAFKFVSILPAPRATTILGLKLFQPLPADPEEAKAALAKKPSALAQFVEWVWKFLDPFARYAQKNTRALSISAIALGIGVGFYTGLLLSSIPSRPLWNSSVIAPLFLISGLASGGAFLCLFLPHDEHMSLVPFSILTCGVELIFLMAYAINMIYGAQSDQRAGGVLFNGVYALWFWGVVVFIGLIVPAFVETFEALKRPLAFVPARVPPLLKLTGGVALRFVIVYAGLLSFL
ncbi:MAG: polysulfide reductase NrfD, partial [Chloroflexi bacterium]|nr:polysulfide reductase NrfD [Chloroflexota bacterium]